MKTSREKILQSALQLFMSMNYERVSLEMVSRSVGLTKTGIFNYYPSKLDLFVDVAACRTPPGSSLRPTAR